MKTRLRIEGAQLEHPLRQPPDFRAEPPGQPQRCRWRGFKACQKIGTRHHRKRRRRQRNDACRARPAIQRGELAENVAWPEVTHRDRAPGRTMQNDAGIAFDYAEDIERSRAARKNHFPGRDTPLMQAFSELPSQAWRQEGKRLR